MKNHLTKFCLPLIFSVAAGNTFGQGIGSSEAVTGTVGLSGTDTTSSIAETLYIGPGNHTLDGTWLIYSKYVWISPDAIITGSGRMVFNSPSTGGGTASPTLIDGNNNPALISVNMVQNNPLNMVLADIPGSGSPWNDVGGNGNLTTGKNFLFNIANGDVLLGNYDMVTASTATLSGYHPDRFAVTNGTGHLVHQNYTGTFVYPVGIAEGDYTPVGINNTGANGMHVSVQDTAASASDESGLPGMMRTWNIYADNATTAGGSLVQLQHNTATDLAGFSETGHYVSQWSNTQPNTTGDNTGSTTGWQSNTSAAANLSPANFQDPVATIAGSSMRQRQYGHNAGNAFATAATAAGASFTKLGGVPDLTPTLDMDDLNFAAAGDNRDFVINLFNIGQTTTNSAPIIFRINKLPSFTITYPVISGSSNVFGGTPNTNGNWTFTENANFITATGLPVVSIAPGSSAVIGFHIQRNVGIPGNTVQNITPAIMPGSGSEMKMDNNIVTTSVTAN